MANVFNNPSMLSRSWYAVARSSQIRKGQARSLTFFDTKIAIFRRQNSELTALHAYCPHMGADLGLGKVVGDSLLCPYHKWAFNEGGQCTRMAKKGLPESATKTHAFPVVEKFGYIWIFNGENELYPFPSLPWNIDDHFVVAMPANKVGCHPHVIGTNNPDFEHLQTLHGFPFDGEPAQTSDAPHRLTYRYKIKMRAANLLEEVFKWIAGDIYSFNITQHGASNISMDISSKRYQLRTLISLMPTLEGKTTAKFFLFVPKGGSLARFTRWNLLKLPLLIASVLKVQMQDLSIYNNIRFKLPEYEPTMVRHAKMIETLGAFHPSDRTRTTVAGEALVTPTLRDASSPVFSGL